MRKLQKEKSIRQTIRAVSRRITDAEKQFISLKVEKAKLTREKAKLVLIGSFMVYFAAIFLSVMAYSGGLRDKMIISFIIGGATIVFIVSIFPYLLETRKEEKEISDMINELTDSDNFGD
jgi:hypothetical protein